MNELQEQLDDLKKQAECTHEYERDYVSNGNMGGFSCFLTYCTNCDKQLSEDDC